MYAMCRVRMAPTEKSEGPAAREDLSKDGSDVPTVSSQNVVGYGWGKTMGNHRRRFGHWKLRGKPLIFRISKVWFSAAWVWRRFPSFPSFSDFVVARS